MALAFRAVDDASVWDRQVFAHAPGSLFQSWGWGEVITAAGGSIWRIGIFDGSALVGVMQLTSVRAKRGSFLHVRHGPVLAKTTPQYWKEVTAFLRTKAHEEHLLFVRVSPQIAEDPEHRAMLSALGYRPAPIHAMDAERCWVVDLAPSEEELLAGMRKTTRYEIRQAQRLGVRIRTSTSLTDFAAFLDLYTKTASRHGFVPHTGIQEEFSYFTNKKMGLLFLGYVGKELRSAAFVVFSGQAIYHHGASIPSREPVSALLQWEAIKEAKKRGFETYNFWGIAPDDKPTHPWRGITLFKKGFGGREVLHLHAHDLPVSAGYWISWGVETVRRILKGY